MRVLILGGAGMLGHKLWQQFRDRFDTWVTLRGSLGQYADLDLFDASRTIEGVDASDFDAVTRSVAVVRPDAAINCIGIIKQLPTAKDPIVSLVVNSLFPHRLANLCRAAGCCLIHISTDCVFSGRKGMYTEKDVPDAEDLYGRTKFLGEVGAPGCLTLRTSIIGRELRTRSGLIEWFLSNRGGQVRGYSKAIYSGFTTLAMADILSDLLQNHPDLEGVYQVSSQPIDKYRLLDLVREAYTANIRIEPDAGVAIDRSLDSRRFREATGFVPRGWETMIRAMADDPTPYDTWRQL
jgi:dTDP-4-dehydrorhamnose reductase